jgi:hypothetical protein
LCHQQARLCWMVFGTACPFWQACWNHQCHQLSVQGMCRDLIQWKQFGLLRRRLLLFHDNGSFSAMTAFQEDNSETQLGTAWLPSLLLGSLRYFSFYIFHVFLVSWKLNIRYGCGHEKQQMQFFCDWFRNWWSRTGVLMFHENMWNNKWFVLATFHLLKFLLLFVTYWFPVCGIIPHNNFT